MKKFCFAVLFVFAGILLISCQGVVTPVSDPLDGTAWELVFYGKSQVVEGVTITAIFSEGQIKGLAGCNSFSGPYQVNENRITFGQMVSTMMFCPEPEGLMDQEQIYLAWLTDAQTFEISDGQLKIFRSDGESLTLIPQE